MESYQESAGIQAGIQESSFYKETEDIGLTAEMARQFAEFNQSKVMEQRRAGSQMTAEADVGSLGRYL